MSLNRSGKSGDNMMK